MASIEIGCWPVCPPGVPATQAEQVVVDRAIDLDVVVAVVAAGHVEVVPAESVGSGAKYGFVRAKSCSVRFTVGSVWICSSETAEVEPVWARVDDFIGPRRDGDCFADGGQRHHHRHLRRRAEIDLHVVDGRGPESLQVRSDRVRTAHAHIRNRVTAVCARHGRIVRSRRDMHGVDGDSRHHRLSFRAVTTPVIVPFVTWAWSAEVIASRQRAIVRQDIRVRRRGATLGLGRYLGEGTCVIPPDFQLALAGDTDSVFERDVRSLSCRMAERFHMKTA